MWFELLILAGLGIWFLRVQLAASERRVHARIALLDRLHRLREADDLAALGEEIERRLIHRAAS